VVGEDGLPMAAGVACRSSTGPLVRHDRLLRLRTAEKEER
jgi:hypothetical protein